MEIIETLGRVHSHVRVFDSSRTIAHSQYYFVNGTKIAKISEKQEIIEKVSERDWRVSSSFAEFGGSRRVSEGLEYPVSIQGIESMYYRIQ